MAPECLAGKLRVSRMNEADLMLADVWSFGALIQDLMNANMPVLMIETDCPAFEMLDMHDANGFVGDMYASGHLPSMSDKYFDHRSRLWGQVLCCNFQGMQSDRSKRPDIDIW